MTPVFGDTSYYLALLNPDDEHHVQATLLSQGLRRTVVLTDFVVLELGDGLCSRNFRRMLAGLLTHLRADPTVEIVPATPYLLEAGFNLYTARDDKDWSLTDCISFVVMKERPLPTRSLPIATLSRPGLLPCSNNPSACEAA